MRYFHLKHLVNVIWSTTTLADGNLSFWKSSVSKEAIPVEHPIGITEHNVRQQNFKKNNAVGRKPGKRLKKPKTKEQKENGLMFLHDTPAE